jgi:hypothetical protein
MSPPQVACTGSFAESDSNYNGDLGRFEDDIYKISLPEGKSYEVTLAVRDFHTGNHYSIDVIDKSSNQACDPDGGQYGTEITGCWLDKQELANTKYYVRVKQTGRETQASDYNYTLVVIATEK